MRELSRPFIKMRFHLICEICLLRWMNFAVLSFSFTLELSVGAAIADLGAFVPNYGKGKRFNPKCCFRD